MTRPLALEGWLPVWDVVRRRAALEPVIAWTLEQLRRGGLVIDRLDAIDVDGARARELAQRLTSSSLAPALRESLHAALRASIPELPWQHVLVQTYAHFRILVPGDRLAPVPPHVDFGFGHSLAERNVWLALTDASDDSALRLCGLRESLACLVRSGQTTGVLPDPGTLEPMTVHAGDVLLFTPLHIHAARPPAARARVSIDVRLLPTGGTSTGYSFSPAWSPT